MLGSETCKIRFRAAANQIKPLHPVTPGYNNVSLEWAKQLKRQDIMDIEIHC